MQPPPRPPQQWPPPVTGTTTVTNGAVYVLDLGGTCRVEDEASYLACPSSDPLPSNDTRTQFVAVAVSLNIAGLDIPNNTMELKSLQTNKYCRGVTGTGGQQLIQCDAGDPAAALPLEFNGEMLMYGNQPLTNPGGDAPIVIGGSGTPTIIAPAAVTPKLCGSTSTLSSPGPGSHEVLSSAAGTASVLMSPSSTCMLVLSATSLSIASSSNETVQVLATFARSSAGAYRLLISPPGTLVLQAPSGLAMWASASACLSTSRISSASCFYAQMQDSCELQTRDGAGRAVWRSAAAAASSDSAMLKQQLVSYGVPSVSCVESNVSYSSFLASADTRFKLSVSRGGEAALAVAASGAVVWRAAGRTVPPSAAALCLQPDGQLRISSQGVTLWTSGYLVPAAAANSSSARFTAYVTEQGALRVVDASCRALFATPVQPMPPPLQSFGKPPPRGALQPITGAGLTFRPPQPAPPGMRRPPPPPGARRPPPPGARRPPPQGARRAPPPASPRISPPRKPPPPKRRTPLPPPAAKIARPPPARKPRGLPPLAAKSTAAGTVAPPGAQTTTTPRPPVRTKRAPRPPPRPPRAISAALSAASTFQRTAAMPPAMLSVRAASAAGPRCRPELEAGALCGGLQLCGRDRNCRDITGSCCAKGLACMRENVFTWVCKH
jgi:hypothetical protein